MVLDFVLRPVGEHDLPGLRHLADVIQDGLTTLPPEDSALEDRINQSLRAFDRRIKKAGSDHYLFVSEDSIHFILMRSGENDWSISRSESITNWMYFI